MRAGAGGRALTRDASKAALPAGVDVVEGDLARPESLPGALDGVPAVFLFAAPGSGPGFVGAAEAAGVERVVFLSTGAIDDEADPQPNAIAAFHAEIEREIRASQLTWTILRPGVFAANALVWRHQLKGADTVRGPYAGAATAPVHEADIADVAVAELTEDGHTGAVHELTGPQSLTFVDQVARIADAVGRKLRFEEQPPETARRAMLDQHMPPPIVDTSSASGPGRWAGPRRPPTPWNGSRAARPGPSPAGPPTTRPTSADGDPFAHVSDGCARGCAVALWAGCPESHTVIDSGGNISSIPGSAKPRATASHAEVLTGNCRNCPGRARIVPGTDSTHRSAQSRRRRCGDRVRPARAALGTGR